MIAKRDTSDRSARAKSRSLQVGRRLLAVLAIAGLPFYLLPQPALAQTFEDMSGLLDPPGGTFSWGASAADFDADGDLDIYVPGGSGRLYRNNLPEAFSFTDIFSSTGIEQGSTFGVTFGDYDADGDLDVFLENFGGNSPLYRNNGDGTFTDVSAQVGLIVSGALSQGAAWGDYNRDGHLDLYINEDTGDNLLFRNDGPDGEGNYSFTNTSAEAGVPTQGNSYGMAWGDYNNNGWQDIFIATCNSSPNNSIKHLLRNNQDGTFTDVNYDAGVADSLASWGTVWLDYNNDGFLDIYIGNIHIAPRPGDNRLYRNNGDGTFTNVTEGAGVGDPGDTYSVAAADFDNDGWIDLYAANSNAIHHLYRNLGDGTFEDVTAQSGLGTGFRRAAAIGDYNKDGWMDVFAAGSGGNQLFVNNGGENHWLVVKTLGTLSNSYGVAARVTVFAPSGSQIREIGAGDSFCSQNATMEAHFGLGAATMLDSVVVNWPSGYRDVRYDVEVDKWLVIVENTPCLACDLNEDGVIDILDIIITINLALSGEPLPPDILCAADRNGDGQVNIFDIVECINLLLEM